MILYEKQRKIAYWLKVILGKSNIDVLAAILIKQGENLIELTTQEVIEQACYLENQKKFKALAITTKLKKKDDIN